MPRAKSKKFHPLIGAGRQWLWSHVKAAALETTDLLLPPKCVVCQQSLALRRGTWICRHCRMQLKGPPGPRCPRCAALRVAETIPCAECHQRPRRFDSAIALGPYEHQLRDVVLRMKLPQHQITAYHMGRLLAIHLHRHPAFENLDLLLPMPKYWTDRIRRGTNAAEWIARGIASITQTPVAKNRLVKIRPTRKQSLLSESQRKGNLRGALACKGGVEQKTVLLVDDLLTTGASANEAARVLRRARAARVCVAVVARAQSLRPSEKVGAAWPTARVQ